MFNFFRRKKEQTVIVSISNRTVIRVLLLVLVSVLLLAALKRISHALILIFTSFFLALALNAPVHWLAVHIPGKLRGSRTVATTVSFIIVIILLVAFLASIVPPLVRQTNSFIQAAPHLVADVRNQNSGLGSFVRRYHLTSEVSSLSSQLQTRVEHSTGSAFSTVTKLTSSIFSTLTIFVLTFMMLVEGPRWLEFFKKQLPDENQEHIRLISQNMYKVIKGFVNGQVLLAAIAAALILIPLLILNVSYPVALMVVVFICGLIPLVGHSIGAVIITTVALFHSPVVALVILVYYILYMQVESYIIQPRLLATATNISPLIVFSSVIIGISFDGLLGGLIAIPVAGCLRVLISDYLEHRPIAAED